MYSAFSDSPCDSGKEGTELTQNLKVFTVNDNDNDSNSDAIVSESRRDTSSSQRSSSISSRRDTSSSQSSSNEGTTISKKDISSSQSSHSEGYWSTSDDSETSLKNENDASKDSTSLYYVKFFIQPNSPTQSVSKRF